MHILPGIGIAGLRHPKQSQNRIGKDPSHNHQQDARRPGEYDSVADTLVRMFRVSAAQGQAQLSGKAIPHQQRQRQGDYGKRIHHVGRRIAQVSHALADKNLLYHVVQRRDQHRQHAGYRKARQQLGNRLFGQIGIVGFLH